MTDKIPANHIPLPVPHRPKRVLLDLATVCNLRCPMCTVWGSDDTAAVDSVKGAMSVDAARRLLDEMTGHDVMIQPNMWGEPLLAPEIRQRFIDMKQRGLTVAMNTNGLTLTDELAAFFVAIKLDSVFVSIDAVTKATLKKIRGINNLEKVESAVHRLLKARGDAEFPRIGVSFTQQANNVHERDAFVERWSGIVDCVRIGLLFENGTFGDLEAPAERKPCPALYRTLPVHNDGTVTICCLDGFKQTAVGNVFKDGVDAVWHGEAFNLVRYYHETAQWDKVPFCKSCNGWAQYEFEDEVRDGLLIRRSPEYTYYNRISRLKNWGGTLLGGHERPQLEVAE